MNIHAPYTYPEISPECLAALLATAAPDVQLAWASAPEQSERLTWLDSLPPRDHTFWREVMRELALPKVTAPLGEGSLKVAPRSIIDPGPLYLNIMAVPCLSMRHITPDDLARLYSDEEADNPGGIMGHLTLGSGCLLHLGDDEEIDFAEEWPGYSPAFRDLLSFVHSRGYHYLRLDADAPALPGLPVFTLPASA